jgi:hypothetical protein
LRVVHSAPGQTEALAGGDAVRRRWRRGAGHSLGCSCRSCRLLAVPWRDARRWNPDPAGRIWMLLVLLFTAVRLRWQEVWRRRRRAPGVFNNKAPPFSSFRCFLLMLFRGIRRRPDWCSSTPPWWWLIGIRRDGQASLNKWSLLPPGGNLLLMLSSLSGLGGAEGGWKWLVDSCKQGEAQGDPLKPVIIQARGSCASAISCRYGGNTATSTVEAPFSFAAVARRRLATKWSCPRWLGDGRWQEILA